MMKRITVYTDGSCYPNPGPGGWAAILEYNGTVREIGGGHPQTTNNRMELSAAIGALKALKEPCSVKIYSDSQYLVNGAGQWVHQWIENKKIDKKENADLWKELIELMKKHHTDWIWVQGHNGDEMNEKADKLASKQRELWTPKQDDNHRRRR